MDRSAFTYAASRIRALEESLFNRGDFERMLEAKNAHEAYRILNDTDYAGHVGDIEAISEFQDVLEKSLRETLDLIQQISPDPQLNRLLTLPYDFHNLKTLLKGKKGGKNREECTAQTLHLGSIHLENWEVYLENRQPAALGTDETLAQKIEEAVQAAEKNWDKNGHDPRQIDVTLDEHLFKILLDISQKTENEFLIDLVRLQIDLYNLSLVLRGVLIGQKIPHAVDGGHIPTNEIENQTDGNSENILKQWENGRYGILLKKGIEGFREEQNFSAFEKAKLEKLAEFLQTAKSITVGPEPLLAYFMNRQNSARVIRIILVGKMNHIDEAVLRKNIPHITN